MSLAVGNCAYKYVNYRGKPIFVPSDEGRRIGLQLKMQVERRFEPDCFYYHLREGGHVAAIHCHRARRYFARVDIENFFYGVARNRVARALQELGLAGGQKYAKWSTVKNPYNTPSYALPYGFVQSPLLATLVLSRSPVGSYLRAISENITISVYMDDIAISSNNFRVLDRAYRKLRRKIIESNFTLNEQKCTPPDRGIELFNCHLEHMSTLVTDARQNEFHSIPRSDQSRSAFEEYCLSIRRGNK